MNNDEDDEEGEGDDEDEHVDGNEDEDEDEQPHERWATCEGGEDLEGVFLESSRGRAVPTRLTLERGEICIPLRI